MVLVVMAIAVLVCAVVSCLVWMPGTEQITTDEIRRLNELRRAEDMLTEMVTSDDLVDVTNVEELEAVVNKRRDNRKLVCEIVTEMQASASDSYEFLDSYHAQLQRIRVLLERTRKLV